MKRSLACLLPLLAACSSAPDITSHLTPYRIDVRQGNYVTQEMAAQLKAGQTRDQVRFILGTPLLTDMFHADRWDYVYRFQPGHGELQERHLTVFFQDGKLARVTGDVVANQPASAEPTAPATRVIEIKGDANAQEAKQDDKPGAAPAVAK